jgi:hypothetical protein
MRRGVRRHRRAHAQEHHHPGKVITGDVGRFYSIMDAAR